MVKRKRKVSDLSNGDVVVGSRRVRRVVDYSEEIGVSEKSTPSTSKTNKDFRVGNASAVHGNRPNLSEDESSEDDDCEPSKKFSDEHSSDDQPLIYLTNKRKSTVCNDAKTAGGGEKYELSNVGCESTKAIERRPSEFLTDKDIVGMKQHLSASQSTRANESNASQISQLRLSPVSPAVVQVQIKRENASSEDESEDNVWEDVREAKVKAIPKKKRKIEVKVEEKVITKDIQISVGVESIHKKKLTREEKMRKWLRQLLGRCQREQRRHLHKAHLLCMFAVAIKQNKVCSNDLVKAVCLSFLPLKSPLVTTPPTKWDISHLRRLLGWFRDMVPSVEEFLLFAHQIAGYLQYLQRAHMLVITLRALGHLTRIVYSLQPCCHKLTSQTVEASNAKEKPVSSKKGKDPTKSPYFDQKKTKGNTKQSRAKTMDDRKKVDGGKKKIASSSSKAAEQNMWVEVYLHSLKKWVAIELVSESINEPSKCEVHATKPLAYVIGLDNSNHVKDLTCRYASKWLSVNRKLRCDRDWWFHTLLPYQPKDDDVINCAEDAQLKMMLMDQDFPKTVGEFKGNPLYVLRRHLLKFQAIYPDSAVPLGYIRGEAIYARECVYELHTRETWMKQARAVKIGEVPYKMVKGRPKRSTPLFERDNVKVEVFGVWQTEEYIPPPVVDGIVPRNAYGNVELFKPSMLPAGGVHLPMGNMRKIANKLKIDFAPAMTGWDFHGGWSHPTFEGIVVAKQHEDVLLDAWRADDEETRRKDEEKRITRVYDNWKSLIKGALIRYKLQNKYNLQGDEEAKPSFARKSGKKTKRVAKVVSGDCSDLSVAWPLNRMEGKTSLPDAGHVHVFAESSHFNDPISGVMMKFCSCGLKMAMDKVEQL